MTLGRPDDKTAGIAKDNLGQVGDKGETVSLGCPKEFVRRTLELLYPPRISVLTGMCFTVRPCGYLLTTRVTCNRSFCYGGASSSRGFDGH